MLSLKVALKAFLDVDRVLTAVREYLSRSEPQLIGADYPRSCEDNDSILGAVNQQYHIAQAICEVYSSSP